MKLDTKSLVQKLTDYEIRYQNTVAAKVNLVKPTNLFLIGGRGFSKTTEILVERLHDVTNSMPRSLFGFLSDTYVNAMTNIIPNLLMGFERKGWVEGIHYVVDQAPPNHFEKPFLKFQDTKHTIFLKNGCMGNILSADRPSGMAGSSYVHFFVDESKYVKNDTIKRLIPALRDSRILYEDIPFFRGITATTDMPDVNHPREYDWILRMEKNMDKRQIDNILDVALFVNNLIRNLLEQNKTIEEIFADKEYMMWNSELNDIRLNSTMFVRVSSYANADILGAKYFQNLFDTLEFSEFLIAVLSIQRKSADIKFFGKFNIDTHTFADSYNYAYYDKFSLKQEIKQSCAGLKYWNPKLPIYGGMDFGNMCSLVSAHEIDNTHRSLKEFFTLTESNDNQYIPNLAAMFVLFFRDHIHKNLYLHYDRAGNNYGTHGQAMQFKTEVEKLDPRWVVHLESLGKATVYHDEVYDLFDLLMDERNENAPRLRIDENNCPCLVSSIALTPTGRDRHGRIIMDKSSEKTRDLKKLPMYSTNMATAYVYMIEGMYRKHLPGRKIRSYKAKSY